MIKDFVRDNHAYLKCSECGAEHQIIYFEIVNREDKYDFGVNMDKTIEGIDAFVAKHSICKSQSKQLRIIDGQL